LVVGHGPRDTFDRTHAIDSQLGHRVGLVERFDAGLHDPDVSFAGFQNLACRGLHDGVEDGGLLTNEQRREGDAQNEREVLRGVVHEDAEGNADHARSLTLGEVVVLA
jgi:hypothetical protein